MSSLGKTGDSIATAMSGASGRFSAGRQRLCVLARLSLGISLVSMLPGCLVDDPPPYPEPKQTPPRLDYGSATPPLNQIINARIGDFVTFTIPSTSEDAGDGLNAFLLLDYNGEAMPFEVSHGEMPASTLDDTSRFFEVPWLIRPGPMPGCHRLTLRVSHKANMPLSWSVLKNPKDLAEAYWWLQLDTPAGSTENLLDCPAADAVVKP
jgi:hypothetical protein